MFAPLFLCALFNPLPPGETDAGRMLQKEIVMNASRAEVWHLWTTNEGMRAALGLTGTDIDLKLGGKFEIYFSMSPPAGQRGSEGCTILSYDPLEMFAFTWNAPPTIPALRDKGAKTQVVVRFSTVDGEKTKVHLTHLGIGTGPEWDKYHAYFENAWPRFLSHMQEYTTKAQRPTKDVAPPATLNPLKHEGVIDAPASEVWKAFTTKEGMESWMVPKASMDLRVMGKMLTTYKKDATLGDEHTIENTILAYVPERMLSIRNTKAPKGFEFPKVFQSTWSVCYFEPITEKQTRVRVMGLNYGTDEESLKVRKHFEWGNDQVLKSLQKRFGVK